jgi:hypothetical protein
MSNSELYDESGSRGRTRPFVRFCSSRRRLTDLERFGERNVGAWSTVVSTSSIPTSPERNDPNHRQQKLYFCLILTATHAENATSKTWVVTSLYIGEHCHTKAFRVVGMCCTNEIQRSERILTREGKLAPE